MTSTTSRSAERIVVGIDGSLCSHAAVRWAIDHARPGDTITLVHVWCASPSMVDADLADPADDTAARRFAHHELTRANALPHDDTITLRCEVIHGDPRHCLLRQPGDVLIIGARGHSRLAGMLLGSVSAHLAHHCPMPLVVVPCPGRPTDPPNSTMNGQLDTATDKNGALPVAPSGMSFLEPRGLQQSRTSGGDTAGRSPSSSPRQ